MFTPALDDEITMLVGYLDSQLDAIRASVVGLTEEQATTRSVRSELTISGIITHTTYVMRQVIERVTQGPDLAPPDEAGYAEFLASFALADGQTTAQAMEVFDQVRATYVQALRSIDPHAETVEPPAPWGGLDEPSRTRWRYYLLHHVEELARHAGHADIIREQIDGVCVPSIVATLDGIATGGFLAPYEPAPGTLT